MREQERIKRILSLLERYWHMYPDMRLTQLVFYLAEKNDERLEISGLPDDPYYTEDEELEETLRELLRVRKG